MGRVAGDGNPARDPGFQGIAVIQGGDEGLLGNFDQVPWPVVPSVKTSQDFLLAGLLRPGFPLGVVGLAGRGIHQRRPHRLLWRRGPRDSPLPVITSYSIHYTKLYD